MPLVLRLISQKCLEDVVAQAWAGSAGLWQSQRGVPQGSAARLEGAPHQMQVAVQFLEVYHEEVRDLLGDACVPRQAGGLQLRDSNVAGGGATAAGLATRWVETAEDALALLRHGAAVRATGEQIIVGKTKWLSLDRPNHIRVLNLPAAHLWHHV